MKKPFYSLRSPSEIAALRLQFKEFAEEAMKVAVAGGARLHPRVAVIKAALLAQRETAPKSE